MGGKAAGEKLGFEGPSAAEEGEKLLDNFFRGFPAVYVAIEESKKDLLKNDYVTGLLGRRRHLPWVKADSYEVKSIEENIVYNPYLICNKERPESQAVAFWRKLIDFYKILSNLFQAVKHDTWEYDDEMSSECYDMLSRLATNPYLLDKPYKTKEQLELMKKQGKTDRQLVGFVKHSTTIKYRDEHEATNKRNEKLIAEGKNPIALRPITAVGFDQSITRTIIRDEHKNYITITWKEKILSDIDEYLNCYLKYNNLPDWATKITIDNSIVFPKEPVIIQANTGRKAQALRQCFNARIQGSAATLTKLAMIDIAQDKQMNDMHAKLIIPVHDELLMECPAFYVDQVEKRLPELMCGAAIRANDPIPQACDPDVCDRWYANEMAAHLLDDYNLLVNGNPKKNIKPIPPAEAMAKIIEENSEFPEEAIRHSIETGEELVFD